MDLVVEEPSARTVVPSTQNVVPVHLRFRTEAMYSTSFSLAGLGPWFFDPVERWVTEASLVADILLAAKGALYSYWWCWYSEQIFGPKSILIVAPLSAFVGGLYSVDVTGWSTVDMILSLAVFGVCAPALEKNVWFMVPTSTAVIVANLVSPPRFLWDFGIRPLVVLGAFIYILAGAVQETYDEYQGTSYSLVMTIVLMARTFGFRAVYPERDNVMFRSIRGVFNPLRKIGFIFVVHHIFYMVVVAHWRYFTKSI